MKKRIFFTVMTLMIILAASGSKITATEFTMDSTLVINTEQDLPYFDNVVLITWDGTNSEWFNKLIDNGTLVNTQRVLENGYKQLVRVTSHRTSTDPGLATLESGYGPEITGIAYNQFGVGSDKLGIPDGLTTFERLENSFGEDIQTSMFFSWGTDLLNATYINQSPEMWDSIYKNIERGSEVDYWWASENLTWVPGDTETLSALFTPFSESLGMYPTPLLKAEYLGNKAASWVTNHTSERFYLRIHMTEPDQAGHGYGVTTTEWSDIITPEYMKSLVDCDIATGAVFDVLEAAGVLDKTLFIIGADHGMYFRSHDANPWPADNWVKSETTFVISNTSVKHANGDVPINQKDISPTILAAMGVDLSTLTPAYLGDSDTGIPMWDLSDTELPIINYVKYQKDDGTWEVLSDGSRIGEIFNISMSIFEWCTDIDATLEIDGNVFEASRVSSKSVKWLSIDASEMSGGGKTLLFSLTDSFGNAATLEIDRIKATPISMWISISGLLAIGTIIYIRKRKF